MANVKTFNLSVYLPGNKGTITFRGISRVAVKRYTEYYRESEGYQGNYLEERK